MTTCSNKYFRVPFVDIVCRGSQEGIRSSRTVALPNNQTSRTLSIGQLVNTHCLLTLIFRFLQAAQAKEPVLGVDSLSKDGIRYSSPASILLCLHESCELNTASLSHVGTAFLPAKRRTAFRAISYVIYHIPSDCHETPTWLSSYRHAWASNPFPHR
jgi:hypothetical protein